MSAQTSGLDVQMPVASAAPQIPSGGMSQNCPSSQPAPIRPPHVLPSVPPPLLPPAVPLLPAMPPPHLAPLGHSSPTTASLQPLAPSESGASSRTGASHPQ